ncbi:MAG: hypothetical protein HKN74_02575 [Acidimicrobiia bacterium]|nr:hypothetical protein [Acidimicrobiia bacterium]MBT8217137.1 hypothetical protein [Acidimicrobiia bacterium]NNF09148.1 hypothetical protein [Acidimicrobiia bacterium]NNL70495.1 hypothetical protein [Acidimicrobiia bacterium]
MPRSLRPVVALITLLAACTTTTDPTTMPSSTVAGTPGGRPPRCDVQLIAEQVGTVESAGLTEISGLAASRAYPGVLWAHNDSGDDAAIHALAGDGTALGRTLLPDLTARDWEDIAIGPGPEAGRDYLYLADIGDNRGDRATVQIHRLPEPSPGTNRVGGGETLTLTYSSGPAEAETLLVDPDSGDLVILGKALSGVTPVFFVPGTTDWSTPQQADNLGDIELGTFAVATGGDATDGVVVVRTYDEIFRWTRPPGRDLAATLFGPGCRAGTVRDSQGEAIAIGPDGQIFTTSEGAFPPIHRFAPPS